MENGWMPQRPPTPNIMGKSDILTKTDESTALDMPWNVVVHDDPVNLIEYVTWTLIKIFGYNQSKAKSLTMEVHQKGRSVVWAGQREKAEFYAQQLQSHQLKSSLEKST
jgi:ATP-dependent Clp protease adaptor protein ClpS